ncbi:MAG: hypothetical protein LBR74_05980 [Eubacterium sp.]|nr:hypothetical protein [Eubacterium sp.]
MIKNLDFLIIKLDELEALFLKYMELTNRLSGNDVEDIDENNVLIEKRQAIIDNMERLSPEIAEIIGRLDDKDKAIVQSMLKGENIFGNVSSDENLIYAKILNLKSLQGDILKKDKINSVRFMNKYNEVKGALSEIKDDKKKIDFYNNSKINVKGHEFNING